MKKENRITFCQNLLADAVRIIDQISKSNKVPEEYYKWIGYLIEFIKNESVADPDLKHEIDMMEYGSISEYSKLVEVENVQSAITSGVKYLNFLIAYFQEKSR